MKARRRSAEQHRRRHRDLVPACVSGSRARGARTMAAARGRHLRVGERGAPAPPRAAGSSVITFKLPSSFSSGRTNARPSACRTASTSSTGFLLTAPVPPASRESSPDRGSKPARAAIAATPSAPRRGSSAWEPVPPPAWDGIAEPVDQALGLLAGEQVVRVLLDQFGQMRGQHRGVIDDRVSGGESSVCRPGAIHCAATSKAGSRVSCAGQRRRGGIGVDRQQASPASPSARSPRRADRSHIPAPSERRLSVM